MKNFFIKHYVAIIIYVVVVILFLNAQVCAGRYEGDLNAECSEKIITVVINKIK
jgi:hypothetical protein